MYNIEIWQIKLLQYAALMSMSLANNCLKMSDRLSGTAVEVSYNHAISCNIKEIKQASACYVEI